MCPDRQLISHYVDGELPSPWKEKLETHLESCGECRGILSAYSNLGENLRETVPKAEEKALEAALERVWAKVSGPRIGTRKRIWNHYVTLPLPAAAAAVLVVVVFFALFGVRNLAKPAPQDQVMAVGIGLDDFGMVHMQDMAGVLQYLSSQDSVDFVVIPLPEARKFSQIGEPALINAADYSRITAFR